MRSCSKFLNGLRIEAQVMLDGHGHKLLALGGDFPAPGSRHFGDESVDMEALEETGDSSTVTALDCFVERRGEQCHADIAIAKAADSMLAAHDSIEQTDVLFGCGVESAKGAFSFANGFCALTDQLTGSIGVVDDGKSINVSLVGREGDLSILVEVCNAFGHGAPGHKGFAVSYALTPDHEVPGVVDDCFDPKDKPVLVVHFDPVGFDPVLDTGTRPTFFEVRNDFAFEDPVESFPEEGHYVLGAETQRGVLQQFGIQVLQSGRALEHHIGGELSLIDNPVVLHVGDECAEQGVGPLSEPAEYKRPIQVLELVGKALSAWWIRNPRKGIVYLPEVHFVSFHLSGQPFMAIETNLDGKRKPTLQTHMHQSEDRINEVEIHTQTLASSGDDARSSFADCNAECIAQLQRGKHADKATRDPITLGNTPGLVLLAYFPAAEILKWPTSTLSQLHRMLLDPLGLFRSELFEVLDQQTAQSHELLQPFRPTDGPQMTSKNDPINARQCTHDFVTMFMDKLVHGVPFHFCFVFFHQHYERRTPFLLSLN